jgi:hypothetical protein
MELVYESLYDIRTVIPPLRSVPSSSPSFGPFRLHEIKSLSTLPP